MKEWNFYAPSWVGYFGETFWKLFIKYVKVCLSLLKDCIFCLLLFCLFHLQISFPEQMKSSQPNIYTRSNCDREESYVILAVTQLFRGQSKEDLLKKKTYFVVLGGLNIIRTEAETTTRALLIQTGHLNIVKIIIFIQEDMSAIS